MTKKVSARISKESGGAYADTREVIESELSRIRSQSTEGETPRLAQIKACAEWLATCLRLGLPKSALDDLERLWWQYHADERTYYGNGHSIL